MSTVVMINPQRVRQPTPPHVLLAQVAAGAWALANNVKAWPPFLPTTEVLREATRAAEGLVRLLGQLAVSEGPSDAA